MRLIFGIHISDSWKIWDMYLVFHVQIWDKKLEKMTMNFVVGINISDSSKIWDMYLISHVQIFESEMQPLIPQNWLTVLRLVKAFEVKEKASDSRLGKVEDVTSFHLFHVAI